MSGAIIELKRVESDALPVIAFDYELSPGAKLSTTFADIEFDVRLDTGAKLPIRSMIIDDDDAGTFHFEFAQNEVPEGTHTAELIFHDISVPTETFRIPEDAPFRLVARSRV